MGDVDVRRGAAARELVGRATELALLEGFVGGTVGDGGALLLTGGPGMGKSVLLDAACRMAAGSGTRVLRAAGVQFEAGIGFAGLNQLFLPLNDWLAELPEPHAEALSGALGIGSGQIARPLLISAAALALLREVARERPVLVVVDDVQWLDRASASVLGFVARRLHGSRVGVLGAVRSEADSLLRNAGLPEHEIAPLDERTATRLLDSTFPGLAAVVRRRVLSAAQGNPLALLELPASMTEEQRRGVALLPSALPLNGQLQRLFAQRVQRLPAGTRGLLLLAALDGTDELYPLRAGAAGEDWLDALAPAERDRLVEVDTGADRITFRHPLIGAAVVELATSAERRRARAVLAAARPDDPERRAWHLAEAVTGQDEPAAALLEAAGQRALQKGDTLRAVHALLRAADLSPRGPDRARRLASAAYVGADAAGQLSSVPELLGAARRADPRSGGSLEVTVAAAFHLLNGDGDVDTAHLMLARAIENALAQAVTGPAVTEALHCLMLVCHFSGRDEPWPAFTSSLAALGDTAPPLLSVSARTYGEPGRVSARELRALDELIATIPGESDPTRIVRVAAAAFYVDRLAGCRPALWGVVRDGRNGGAAASAVTALTMLAHDAYRDGRWDDAAAWAAEAVAWSEQLGYRLIALPGLHCQALLAAARGDEQATWALTDELAAWAGPRRAHMFGRFAPRARALAALGRGDYQEAYRLAVTISPPGRLPVREPVALWGAKDLVEAAVRTGRAEEARAHVAAVRETEIFRSSPRLAFLAAGAEALAGRAEQYPRALALPGADRFPFERARLQLSYGEHLRRARATTAARLQFSAALDTFQQLGARPWIAHTLNELRASGQVHRSASSPAGSGALTPQELEIATLAASGLSNKQIGSRLYLSPRTVSGHLYRIFPKLGITTRAALRDALAGPRGPSQQAGVGGRRIGSDGP